MLSGYCLCLFLLLGANHTAFATITCLPDQATALLHVKHSLSSNSSSFLRSWRAGTDCCAWEGVTCDAEASGRATALDLSNRGISGRLHSSLFNLTSLRYLNLAGNHFFNKTLPSFGFERLTKLNYLNLSNSGFTGQVPIGIAHLRSLLSLDLSNSDDLYLGFDLYLEQPSFQVLVSNLTNLRELYLDYVDMSRASMEWCGALAASATQLQVLSMAWCGLSGPIDPVLLQLRSLTVVRLDGNDLSSVVPDFSKSLANLSILQLGYNRFGGLLPPGIFQLKSLREIDLSVNDNLSVSLPPSIGNMTSLQKLDISSSAISGSLPYSIGRLSSLRELDLSCSTISGQIPPSIGNMTSLQMLDISYSAISGPIPFSTGSLSSLQTLDLTNCSILGPLPTSIANLTLLVRLFLSYNNLTGEIPSIVKWPQISEIDLSYNSLTGRIPYSFRNYTFPNLTYLNLMNNALSGTIPHTLFTLPALEELHLASNQLSGPIQSFSKPSLSVLSIDLSNNGLNGSIPTSFFGLTSLTGLYLASNKLDGTIELQSFLGLQNLNALFLSNNRLSVTDRGESSLYRPLSIYIIGLASCKLTKFPAALRYLKLNSTQFLDLSSNQISGSVPKWIWESLQEGAYLNLSHNMFTSLEESPVVIKPLDVLDLSFNSIGGPVPIPQGFNSFLDYSSNEFTFILPNFTMYMNSTVLKASRNKLSGSIQNSICSASALLVLDLSYNNFSGHIPSCLMQGGNSLSVLSLRGNKMHGMLPQGIKNGCFLTAIDLNNNLIEGKLPRSLTRCTNLEILDLGDNHILDTFPSWLRKLPKLQVLVLRSNYFHGSIGFPTAGDSSNEFFPSLKIIDLASNNFSGSLDPQWFQRLQALMTNDDPGQIMKSTTSINGTKEFLYYDIVTVTFKGLDLTFTKILNTFAMIDFSNNEFYGGIPVTIAVLIALHGLNLAHNAFTGQIPPQLGGLSQLESLDLSSNHLIGEIPQELTNLMSLAWLNLSYNNLTGRIPQERQFITFPQSAFEGNMGLCGTPLPKQCSGSNNSEMPTATSPLRRDRTAFVLLFVFIGSGFGIGLAVVIVIQIFCKKH